MSYTDNIKEELYQSDLKRECCKIAALCAVLRLCGSMEIGVDNSLSLRLDTENEHAAWFAYKLVRDMYGYDSGVMERRQQRFKDYRSYTVEIADQGVTKKLLYDSGILINLDTGLFMEHKLPTGLLSRDCCRKAYLKAVFLCQGRCSNPRKTYRLEYIVKDMGQAETVSNILKGFQLNSHITRRRDGIIIYINEAEQIISMLSIIGANKALLDMENIMIMKQIRNHINRAVNCETANLDKVTFAAQRQIDDIKLLISCGEYNSLADSEKQTAEARINNPEATLSELAQLMGVTKSGINHRLRRISDRARRIKEQGG